MAGLSSWLVQIENSAALLDRRKNLNQDKNLYLHYFWRVKKTLKGDVQTKPMDLIWVGLEQKVVALGSTTLQEIYFFNFHFEKMESADFYSNWYSLQPFTWYDFLQEYLPVKESNSVPMVMNLEGKPRQLLGLDQGRFLVLFEEPDGMVRREIFTVDVGY